MISRRIFLASSASIALTSSLRAEPSAIFTGAVDASTLGLEPNSNTDQSRVFQAAIDTATAQGLALQLPAGTFRVAGISLPDHCIIRGSAGRSVLQLSASENILYAKKSRGIQLLGVTLRGNGGKNADDPTGLLYLEAADGFMIRQCHFQNAATQGIYADTSAGRILDCNISNIYGAGVASRNGNGLWIARNRISDCGNLGIYIERGEQGPDNSIITQNHISGIDWLEGGNGQNGNGINIFKANNVVISDNVISDCAFSAVRLNSTADCQITGNNCRNLSEVAIFSEFDFSGSIISDNIINEAAQGIAITNFNDGGRLAICADNIVRNIWPHSPTNPDTTPVGIGVEADTTVTGNVVENVPGVGIALGWGPYLRDLNVSGNIVRNCNVAIGVSVVDGVGNAVISNNLLQISNKQLAIAGTEWDDITQPNMLENAENYPLLSLNGNHISR